MKRYFLNGKKSKKFNINRVRDIVQNRYTFLRRVGEAVDFYEIQYISLFGKLKDIVFGYKFNDYRWHDERVISDDKADAFEEILKEYGPSYLVFHDDKEKCHKFIYSTKDAFQNIRYDNIRKKFIDMTYWDHQRENNTEYLPKEYYDKYDIDGIGKLSYIKSEYIDKIKNVEHCYKFVEAVLGYKFAKWITKEDYAKVEETLKEWREPKHIKGTTRPPYFLVGNEIFQAAENENWYEFLCRTFYQGAVQPWMLE